MEPRTLLRIEHARRSLGLTQIDLSRDTRIAQFFISLIERGMGVPHPEQAERLASRLGLHPDDLLKPVDLIGLDIEREQANA